MDGQADDTTRCGIAPLAKKFYCVTSLKDHASFRHTPMDSDNFTLNNCTMGEKERGEFDIIAILRLITASLSILGTFSIIGSAVCGKTVCNPKVQPIFILSVADALLSVLWISGSLVWLRGGLHHLDDLRVSCFSITLLTVTLQCVAMNLTLIYAVLAYFSIRKSDVYIRQQRAQIWKRPLSFFMYFVAWTMPLLLILPMFGVLSAKFGLIEKANTFSCWCLPFYGNMLPRPQIGQNTDGRKSYLVHLHSFITSYAAVLLTNFCVVLVSMIAVYCAILMRIRHIRQENENTPLNGATRAMVVEGQREANKRVLIFISIYVVTGVMTLFWGIIYINFQLYYINKDRDFPPASKSMEFIYIFMVLEALLVPLQGFLNAIAYGWTRSGFLSAVSTRPRRMRSGSETDALATSLGTVDENREETDEEDNGGEPPTSVSQDEDEVHAGKGRNNIAFANSGQRCSTRRADKKRSQRQPARS